MRRKAERRRRRRPTQTRRGRRRALERLYLAELEVDDAEGVEGHFQRLFLPCRVRPRFARDGRPHGARRRTATSDVVGPSQRLFHFEFDNSTFCGYDDDGNLLTSGSLLSHKACWKTTNNDAEPPCCLPALHAGVGYFSVAAVGTASQVAIEDEYVRFVAGAAGRAGVRVTLDGAESSDRVTVEAADDMLSSRKRRRRPQNSD